MTSFLPRKYPEFYPIKMQSNQFPLIIENPPMQNVVAITGSDALYTKIFFINKLKRTQLLCVCLPDVRVHVNR